MDNSLNPQEWLKRAKSNLILGKQIKFDDENIWEEIYYEDLCFALQQCVEKAFKGVLIKNNIDFQRTHSIALLIDLLISNKIEVPENLFDATLLSPFAVKTKYPGDWPKISKKEYESFIEVTEHVYQWAYKQIIQG